MFGWIGRNVSKVSQQIGQGIKKGWGTIGGIGRKINNGVNSVASFVHNATSGLSNIPLLDKVHQISGDVVRYSDLFNKGLDFGDKVANSLERVTKTASDLSDGKLNSHQLRDRLKEHAGEGRGHIQQVKEGLGGMWKRR